MQHHLLGTGQRSRTKEIHSLFIETLFLCLSVPSPPLPPAYSHLLSQIAFSAPHVHLSVGQPKGRELRSFIAYIKALRHEEATRQHGAPSWYVSARNSQGLDRKVFTGQTQGPWQAARVKYLSCFCLVVGQVAGIWETNNNFETQNRI